ALTDVEVLQASLATCSLKRASYLFMHPSGLDLTSNSRGSLHGWVYGVSCTATPPRQTISNPEPLWLLLRPLLEASAGAGRSPAEQPST
ncbi:hypothetical protein, partial [Stenotrophomonas maltophilia]|uniref:hypothetical protein n=1 Tax=Stenotrophomonas maltophilia TaxID=40324 RepID=UPI003BF78550